MKTITFKYTKDNGDVSQRTLVVSTEPVKNVSGVDISELEAVDQAAYVEEVKKAHLIYLEMLSQINEEFDVVRNYRQFKPAGMTDIKVL